MYIFILHRGVALHRVGSEAACWQTLGEHFAPNNSSQLAEPLLDLLIGPSL